MNLLQNPPFLSPILSRSWSQEAFISQAFELCKWRAIFLATLACFGTLIHRAVKLLAPRFLKSTPLVAQQPLVADFDNIDDDTCSSLSEEDRWLVRQGRASLPVRRSLARDFTTSIHTMVRLELDRTNRFQKLRIDATGPVFDFRPQARSSIYMAPVSLSLSIHEPRVVATRATMAASSTYGGHGRTVVLELALGSNPSSAAMATARLRIEYPWP
ncbi:hypothetical protein NL676_017565 [Syzygium grande]|nr:hypothetical protein NL676_017565 [Syzygium grande]